MKKTSFRATALLAILFAVWLNSTSSAIPDKTVSTSSFDVLFYRLDLNVSDSSTYLTGSVEITLQSLTSSLPRVVLDFSNKLTTDSVTIDGQIARFTHAEDALTIKVNEPVMMDDKIRVRVYYHGLGKNVVMGEGISHEHVTAYNKNVTWTLSEPFAAKNWFPCKQILADKADSAYVFLSTNKNLKAGSNGILSASVPLPGDRVRYEWKCRFPIAYYLISFSVADYMDYSFYVKEKKGNDSILVQNYLYNDSAYFRQNKSNIDKTGDLLLLYSGLFGPYPYAAEKYGHCVAPLGGGMEHQTMTTLVNFGFLLVAHELSHQWFGDLVTCNSWQHIWINEGFASYCEYLANQYLVSQKEADAWITRYNRFVRSIPNGSVFVPESDMEDEHRIFDSRLSYKKGAFIIHMIRQEIGSDSLFFSILTGFLQEYKFGNASADDFKDFLEKKTNKDFDGFFKQWYYGQGYPTHNVTWEQSNDTLYISSFQTVSSETPLFNVLMEFKVAYDGGDTLVQFRQYASLSRWQMVLPRKVIALKADPKLWLLADITEVSHFNKNSDSAFSISPNPSSDRVTIRTENPMIKKYELMLVNTEGKIISHQNVVSPVEEIDVKGLTSGLYFVIVKSEKTIFQKKLLIK